MFMSDHQSSRNDKMIGWNAAVSLASAPNDGSKPAAFKILDHPTHYQPPAASHITYQPHIPTTTGTAAYYNDVAPLLDKVRM